MEQNPRPSGPGEELNDPERKQLIQILNEKIQGRPVPIEAWACLWLSDIEALRDLAGDTPIHFDRYRRAIETNILAKILVQPCPYSTVT